MKYLFDVDAFRGCLDLLETIKVNGNDMVFLNNVKILLDRFPKDNFEIPPLIVNKDTDRPHFEPTMTLSEVETELDKIRKRKCPDETREFGIVHIE